MATSVLHEAHQNKQVLVEEYCLRLILSPHDTFYLKYGNPFRDATFDILEIPVSTARAACVALLAPVFGYSRRMSAI